MKLQAFIARTSVSDSNLSMFIKLRLRKDCRNDLYLTGVPWKYNSDLIVLTLKERPGKDIEDWDERFGNGSYYEVIVVLAPTEGDNQSIGSVIRDFNMIAVYPADNENEFSEVDVISIPEFMKKYCVVEQRVLDYD